MDADNKLIKQYIEEEYVVVFVWSSTQMYGPISALEPVITRALSRHDRLFNRKGVQRKQSSIVSKS